jgi:hypothetical protein
VKEEVTRIARGTAAHAPQLQDSVREITDVITRYSCSQLGTDHLEKESVNYRHSITYKPIECSFRNYTANAER